MINIKNIYIYIYFFTSVRTKGLATGAKNVCHNISYCEKLAENMP